MSTDNNTDVQIELVTRSGEWLRIRPEWDKLLAGTDSKTVFQGFDWQWSWWQSFSGSSELMIFLLYEGQKLQTIAPLMCQSERKLLRTLKTIRFIGTPLADYNDFIGRVDGLALNLIMERLLYGKCTWHRVEFSQIPQGSNTSTILVRLLREKGVPCRCEEGDQCCSFVFEGAAEKRSEFNFRRWKNLRNAVNFLKQQGPLTLEAMDGKDAILKALPNFFLSHIHRWTGTSTPSVFLHKEYRLFYEMLSRSLAGSGRIRLFVLKTGELPLSYLLAFCERETVRLYTIAHNSFYLKRSPALVLLDHIIEHSVKAGFSVVDFSRGTGLHKQRFCNRQSNNSNFTLFKSVFQKRSHELLLAIKNFGLLRRLLRCTGLEDLLKNAVQYSKRNGLAGLAKTLVRRVLRVFVDYQVFFVYTHSGRTKLQARPRIPVRMVKVNNKDLDRVAIFQGTGPGEDKYRVIQERVNTGADCFIAEHEGNIVAVVWGVFSDDRDPNSTFVLTPGDGQVVLSDAFASPVFRGMRITPWLISEVISYYAKKGLRPITAIRSDNKSSLRLGQIAGYECLYKVRKLSVLGINVL